MDVPADDDDKIKTYRTLDNETPSDDEENYNSAIERLDWKIIEPNKALNADKKKFPAKPKDKGTFHFPDGGWECSTCQNYNFRGRKECNRCKKPKTKQDTDGKPLHLLK